MQEFSLPTNIKQIGSIGDGLRVYMEDYVCTFLQQYTESAGFEERLAFLVGKHMVIDGQQFLFIGGAIYGRYAEKHEGHLRFSEKSIDYAEEMLEGFFHDMEIVGWAQSQPSYGTFLNQFYAAYHLRQFRRPYQVMFVIDPLERTNTFYVTNPAAKTPAERVAEIPGYFIYYEKNTAMHEYMLVNKSVEYTAKSPKLVELTPLEYAKEEPDEPKIGRRGDYNEYEEHDTSNSPVTGYDDYYEEEKHTEGRFSFGGPPRRNDDPEEIIRRREMTKARRKGTMQEQKRATGLLAGLCAVLFVVCFIMGVGLIRNQDRLDGYGQQIRQLTTALRNHLAIDFDTFDEIAHVFAGEDPTIPTVPGLVDGNGDAIPAIIHDEPVPPPINTPPPTPQPTPQPTPEPTPEPTIPPSATTETPALITPVPETYVIQPGDSLLAIALYFFGDANMVNEILVLNDLENPDMIIAGRTISLPRR